MIRKLKKGEIKKIAEMYEKVMFKNFLQVGEKPISKERYQKILEENYDKSFMFVLEERGIKGFLWFIEKDKEINLEEIFTIKRNKGYGKKLLCFLIKKAKKENKKRINLDVHFKNKRAIEFFKKRGFTERTIELSLDLD